MPDELYHDRTGRYYQTLLGDLVQVISADGENRWRCNDGRVWRGEDLCPIGATDEWRLILKIRQDQAQEELIRQAERAGLFGPGRGDRPTDNMMTMTLPIRVREGLGDEIERLRARCKADMLTVFRIPAALVFSSAVPQAEAAARAAEEAMLAQCCALARAAESDVRAAAEEAGGLEALRDVLRRGQARIVNGKLVREEV